MYIVYVFLLWSLTLLDRGNSLIVVVKQEIIRTIDLCYTSDGSMINKYSGAF